MSFASLNGMRLCGLFSRFIRQFAFVAVAVFAAQAANAEANQCAFAFHQAAVIEGTVNAGASHVPNDFHVFNMKKLVQPYIQSGKAMIMYPEQIATGFDVLCMKYGCMAVSDRIYDPNNRYQVQITLTDVNGTQYSAIAAPMRAADGTIFSQVTFLKYLPTKKHVSLDLERLQKQNEKVENRSEAELTIKEAQLTNSSNASETPAGVQYKAAVAEASRLLAQAIKKEGLDIAGLERLNFLLNQGIHPYRNAKYAYLAGILRGTRSSTAEFDGKLQIIDLTNYQVKSGNEDFIAASFAPPWDVPRMTQSLLRKMNAIGPHSSLQEILNNYRTLVTIHPFADGNGRTARMILNYMLLKANLPVPKRPVKSLWATTDQMIEDYLAAVTPAP